MRSHDPNEGDGNAHRAISSCECQRAPRRGVGALMIGNLAIALYATATLTVAVVLAALAVVLNRRSGTANPKRLDLDDPAQRRRWETSE
jgi:hypothetical protein